MTSERCKDSVLRQFAKMEEVVFYRYIGSELKVEFYAKSRARNQGVSLLTWRVTEPMCHVSLGSLGSVLSSRLPSASLVYRLSDGVRVVPTEADALRSQHARVDWD